jgi:hypothetical protein
MVCECPLTDQVLSSDEMSENAHDDRFDSGWVGERCGTMSRKWRSSNEKLAKGVAGGE